MPLYAFKGTQPSVSTSAYVHPTAVVIGDVKIGERCYIGPHASLRGDFGTIVIGSGSNVQDGCVLHVGVGETCWLDVDSHVGHGAIVHGAWLERNVMIGMNAVVMDDARIGESSIVAACAFVKSGLEVPSGVLFAGVPGRIVRPLSQTEISAKSTGTRIYQQLAEDCLSSLRPV